MIYLSKNYSGVSTILKSDLKFARERLYKFYSCSAEISSVSVEAVHEKRCLLPHYRPDVGI